MATKTFDELHAETRKLVKTFEEYRPDIIAPCMLGGLFPGLMIAKELGINDVRPIDIEREGDKRRLVYDVQGPVGNKKVLIVEDDMPTGKGSAIVKKMFEQRRAEVKIAALYVTPESRKVADFYIGEYPNADELPDYPYKRHNVGDRLRQDI